MSRSTRRSLGSDFLAQTRPDDCRDLSHNWVRPPVCGTLHIQQRLCSVNNAQRAGGPRKLRRVWSGLVKKMRRKMPLEASDCKGAQETEGRRCELPDSAENSAPS